MAENVLVIAPHPDDEAIGCGGTICLHRDRGDSVHVVFLTSGERYTEELPPEQVRSLRESEAERASVILDVQGLEFLRQPDLGLSENVERAARQLAAVVEARVPAVIYLPHPRESHPDHEAVLPILRAALAPLSFTAGTPELRGYEVWSPLSHPDWLEDISGVMTRKLRAVRCYRSQLHLFRYDLAVRGLNRYRGVLGAGSRYAEGFVALDVHGEPPG